MVMRSGCALSRWLFSLQQWFMFIWAGVEQVHTVVFSSYHPSVHLVLLLQLWPRGIGSTTVYDTICHQGGDTRTVAIGNYRVNLVPNNASHAGVVSNCGYQVGLYSRGDCYCVHFSNTCFHLKYRTVWVSDANNNNLY